MSRRRAPITQADIARAIRAAKQAGLRDYEVVIEGPRVIVRVPGNPLAPGKPEDVGSWDIVVADLERQ
jgi:hypothetical protein